MDIYTELKADHQIVKKLLNRLDATTEKSPKKRLSLLKQLKTALVPHSRAEEKVLYDRLKESDVKEADDLAFEGYEEHAVVDRLMEQLETVSPTDKKWTALLSVAKESLEHHIEEEESEMFKKARKSFESDEAKAMRGEFLELKATCLEELKEGKSPQQPPSTELAA